MQLGFIKSNALNYQNYFPHIRSTFIQPTVMATASNKLCPSSQEFRDHRVVSINVNQTLPTTFYIIQGGAYLCKHPPTFCSTFSQLTWFSLTHDNQLHVLVVVITVMCSVWSYLKLTFCLPQLMFNVKKAWETTITPIRYNHHNANYVCLVHILWHATFQSSDTDWVK